MHVHAHVDYDTHAHAQAAARRERIVSLMSVVRSSLNLMRAGNIFIKFSQNGPPHDRWALHDAETMPCALALCAYECAC